MSGERDPASTPNRAEAAAEARSGNVTRELDVLPTTPDRKAQPRVLIIASSAANAAALRELLRVDGRQIEIAHEGTEGLRLADRLRPDVVVCDLQLRGIPSAYALARDLRSDPSLRHLYLIGLTSTEVAACEEYAVRSGFDEVLNKSGEIAMIEELIANHWWRERR